MRIIQDTDADVITMGQARKIVEDAVNNTTYDFLYIVKYDGKMISFSTRYYKFTWRTMRDLKNALTTKFGKELSEALVENNVLEVVKVYI